MYSGEYVCIQCTSSSGDSEGSCVYIHVRIFMVPYFSVRMDLIIIMEMSYEGWKNMEAVLY